MVFRKVYYVRLSASTVAMCLRHQYSIEYVYVRARARATANDATHGAYSTPYPCTVRTWQSSKAPVSGT